MKRYSLKGRKGQMTFLSKDVAAKRIIALYIIGAIALIIAWYENH